MLNKITFGLTVFTGLGLFAGLDKLVNIFLLLSLFLIKKCYNSLIDEISSDDSIIISYFQNRRGVSSRSGLIKVLKILANAVGATLLLFVLYQLYWLSLGGNLSGYETLERLALYIACCVGLIFYCVFSLRLLLEKTEKQSLSDIIWYRAIAYFATAHALVFFIIMILGMFAEEDMQSLLLAADFGFFLGFFVIALLTAELLVGFLRNFTFLLRHQACDVRLPAPFFVGFFAAEDSLKKSLVKSIETISGVDVSRSEIVSFCVKIFEPVCIVAVITIWLLSALVIVDPTQEAVFSRFGKIAHGRSFGPGMYLKLPWPFATVEHFDAYKIKALNIGFEPDPKQRHIIWTKSHAVKYFDLIVGDGVEIIAIDCQVMFRISDLFRYVTRMANPDEFISATAYKLLTEETVSARFDDIIARDRKVLASHLKTSLQNAVDLHDLGIEIVEVVFFAMHPPLEVAADFEDVISAQIDSLTYVLKANTENSFKLSMNQALARGRELEAESYAANHVAKAVGESSSFVSRTLGYEYEPELTRFRLRCEMMQKVLEGKSLYIYDKSLMRKEDKLFIDINDQGR